MKNRFPVSGTKRLNKSGDYTPSPNVRYWATFRNGKSYLAIEGGYISTFNSFLDSRQSHYSTRGLKALNPTSMEQTGGD